MKLTNMELLNAREPMSKLLTVKLPMKLSFKIAKVVATLNEHLAVITSVGQGLRETYGEKNPLNGQYEVILPGDKSGRPVSPGAAEFAEKYGELMKVEVEVDFEAITLPDTVEIEPMVLMSLGKFIKV